MFEKLQETSEHLTTKGPEERIRELKERANELAGEEVVCWTSEDIPPEVLERFWENVVAYEEANAEAPYDLLVAGGLELPPAAELDDEALPEKLHELVQAMALEGIHLLNTNHLSDRELYQYLLEDVLREEMVIPMGKDGPMGRWIIDMVGSGSEESVYLDLKYYADEEERRRWAEEWPDDEIPEHEDPPYDRDRALP